MKCYWKISIVILPLLFSANCIAEDRPIQIQTIFFIGR